MTLFNTDEIAWSKLTAQYEARLPNTSPNIVQVNTIMRPLSCRTKWPGLNLYRRMLVGDSIPTFTKANSGAYLPSNMMVSDSYEQYLLQLNVEMHKKAPGIDEHEANAKLTKYDAALKKLKSFEAKARASWQSSLIHHPNKTRAKWEEEYQYREQREPLANKVAETYSDYLAVVAAYPPLFALAKALRALNDPKQFMKLPMNEDEAQFGVEHPNGGDETWAEFRATFLDFDLDEFFKNDAPETVQITESSSQSTSYENRWGGSAGASGLFWSFGASADGGTIDRHLREDASRFAIRFKKLIPAPVTRKIWYLEKFIVTYNKLVNRDEYWSATGMLSMLPRVVLLGRGPSIEIDTQTRSYSEFQTWYNVHASGGFSLGPISIGGSGGSSMHYTDIKNSSSGTTIRIEDTSDQIYVVGVASLRPIDLYESARLRMEAEVAQIDGEIADADSAWSRNHRRLFAQGAVAGAEQGKVDYRGFLQAAE